MLSRVHYALTITLDNGGEFADHERVSQETGATVYFAKPYASWQRRTNVNTNGRLRRFWPKKFDLAALSDKDILDGVYNNAMSGPPVSWRAFSESVLKLPSCLICMFVNHG